MLVTDGLGEMERSMSVRLGVAEMSIRSLAAHAAHEHDAVQERAAE